MQALERRYRQARLREDDGHDAFDSPLKATSQRHSVEEIWAGQKGCDY